MTISRLPFAALLAASLLRFIPDISAAEPHLAPAPAPLSLESLFADSEMSSVQLAPDGKHLAFLAKLGTGRIGVALMTLETGKVEPLVVAKDENYASFFWKGSDRIVFGGDVGGRESLSLRAISLSTRRVVVLAEAFKELVADRANQAMLVDQLQFDENHILIYGNKDIGSGDFSIYRLNVTNADRTKQSGLGDVGVNPLSLTADGAGVVRARDREVGKQTIHEVRADGKSSYYQVGETPTDIAIETATWQPVEFNADNRTLYVITRAGQAGDRLRAYDTVNRTFLPEPDFQLEGSFRRLVLSWDHSKLLGVYLLKDRPQVHWFDPARAALQAKIDAALPDTFNGIVSSSQDEQTHIIGSFSDRDPGTYYVLSLANPARGRPAIMQLGRINSRVLPAQLQPQQSISYLSRDGLTIHGYLTLPVGAAGKRVPLIVHPHGGPYGIRDNWGFDPEVQFMASRGYAVLQPNYRGSGGYGTDFLLAGRREWGGKMQDDLTDGVKWAIAQGIADPDRVAIVGASYGGYAALAGVTFTPELYRCAVNYVGVSDLTIIAGHARDAGSDRVFERNWTGDDPEYLRSRSPVNFVQNIRVPTLHAYGENDPRVDIDNWKRLKAQLDKYQKPYEFVREGNEGHGFRHEDARINFYRQVETFLAKNLLPEGKVKLGELKTTELPAREAK